MHQLMGDLRLGGLAIRYSLFIPQLYHWCLSLGFARSRIMPSRAFCSDESQGYPVILMAQHFGTFPFDHGRVGGKVATDRHGPHAHHGEDLVIVQASHVGYDPATRSFGVYPRPRTAHGHHGTNCGKLCGVLDWYQTEYVHAAQTLALVQIEAQPCLVIDNALLDPTRPEGLFLHLEALIGPQAQPLRVLSTSKVFPAAHALVDRFGPHSWTIQPTPIATRLTADLFSFRRGPVLGPEGHDLLEEALQPAMPSLVTSDHPPLDAARYHTQIEFDRTFRSIQREPAYADKNVLFIAGLNIDVAPQPGLLFPLTKFVPWAAYAQLRDGRRILLEQQALFDTLSAMPTDNPDAISFDQAIAMMATAEAIEIPAV